MPLSDVAVRSAKPQAKEFKLSDSEGLYILVTPRGTKIWNLAYRFNGKQKKLTIGRYPVVGLAEARDARSAAKRTLATGADPAVVKKLSKIALKAAAENTFAAIGDELIEIETRDPRLSKETIKKHRWLLDQLNPVIGDRPISKLSAAEVLVPLRQIEKTGRLETAIRARSMAGRVFRFAIRTARADHDPSAPLVGATQAPVISHHAAITDERDIGSLLRALDSYQGNFSTRMAFKLVAHTFVRSKELRFAVKPEFDLEGAMWTIPAERMKMDRPHYVPLSRQTVDVVREVFDVARGDLLFPGTRSSLRPISENTINAGLRRMGYEKVDMTGHGFRTMASTRLNEMGWNPDWVERQLAHKDPNRVRRAYNAAEYLQGRIEMMQSWSDYLDKLAASSLGPPAACEDDEEDLIG